MILIATLVSLITGAAAMLPLLVVERRRRRIAEGRLALAHAADPTVSLLADVRPVRGAHRRGRA